jgi:hypothetical protein
MTDKEWRDLVWQEIKELRKENRAILETLTTVKVKIGLIVAVASSIISIFVSYVSKKLGA